MTLSEVTERFWAQVNKTSSCWLWTGTLGKDQYGLLHNEDGKTERVHRFSFRLHYGHLPVNHACHHCDVKRCVRPDHLFDGTDTDNMRDALRKGRMNLDGLPLGTNYQRSKTHCPKGHAYSEENTELANGNVSRRCKICHRGRVRIYDENHRAEKNERNREYRRRKSAGIP